MRVTIVEPQELDALAVPGTPGRAESAVSADGSGKTVTLFAEDPARTVRLASASADGTNRPVCVRWLEVQVSGEGVRRVPLPLAADLTIPGVTALAIRIEASEGAAACIGSQSFAVTP
jgi:hypothetical protein